MCSPFVGLVLFTVITERQKHSTDSITLTADAGGKNSGFTDFQSLFLYILFFANVALIFYRVNMSIRLPIISSLRSFPSRPTVRHPYDVTKTRSTSKLGLLFQSTIQKAYQWPAQFTPAHVFIPELVTLIRLALS